MRFGGVQSLHESARYIQKIERPDRAPLYKTISWAEYRKLNPKLRVPQMGILELGQTLLHVSLGGFTPGQPVSADNYDVRRQDLITPPCVMTSTTASCIYSSLNVASPSFDLESISRWCEETVDGVAVLNDCPDNVSANMRCKKAIADKLPARVLFDASCGCCVHKCHNIVTQSSGEERLVGHVHACAH
eukprot:3343421-Pyramimonas_sp.AAC.1